MAAPAGYAGQWGYKSETTWGTAVTVDQFRPFVSESIKADRARLISRGIRAGRRSQSLWAQGRRFPSGQIEMEMQGSMATLLRHMFGTIAVTGTGVYTHTASPGDLTGKSLTIQIGRPDQGGTVQPFQYDGCKFNGWEIAASVNEFAMLRLDVVAKDETTAVGLASASYSVSTSLDLFVFTGATVSVAGSAFAVHDFSLRADNKLRTEHQHLGSAVTAEQRENGVREYTGSFTGDFSGLTAYNRFVDGTEYALVSSFTNGNGNTLVITMNVEQEGDTPVVAGEEQLDLPINFRALSATSDTAAITAVLTNGEASNA